MYSCFLQFNVKEPTKGKIVISNNYQKKKDKKSIEIPVILINI